MLSIGAGYAGGFFRTDLHTSATPDVQVHSILFTAEASGGALHPFPGFIASVCQLRPESCGCVRIKSADPREPPAIQPRYLTTQNDRDTLGGRPVSFCAGSWGRPARTGTLPRSSSPARR